MAPPISRSSKSSTKPSTKSSTQDFPFPHNLDVSKLSSDGKEIVAVLITYFDQILQAKDAVIEDLQGTVSNLKTRVSKLEEQVDANSAYERRDALIISGDIPEAAPGENCNNLVRSLLREQIKINLNADDISVAHRIGRKPKTQGPDKRNLIFKLCRRDVKRDIIHACKQVKPKFYVNESLTPLRSTIMYVLRQAIKRNKNVIGSCKSIDGNIIAWLPTPTGSTQVTNYRRIILNTKSALVDFLHTHINAKIEDFIDVWPDV